MARYSNLIKFLLPVFILGCASNSEKTRLALEEVIKSLESSNITIHRGTKTVLYELKNKLSEPASVYKAEIWYPKANLATQYSTELFNYIESLKNQIKNQTSVKKVIDNDSGQLYKKIKMYKVKLFDLDSSIKDAFGNTFVFTTLEFDSIQTINSFERYFFNNTSSYSALALLTKFQNNVKINENKIVAYCNNKVASYDPFYTTYSVIIGQNAEVLRPGSFFEINAGVGAFSAKANPTIIINRDSLKIDERGIATYKLKTQKPGLYKVPVIIKYINEFGLKQEIHNTIEYTVSDCKN